MKKKSEMQKQSRKCTFHLKIHAKTGKNAKKRQKCKKGRKGKFHLKIHAKKEQKCIFIFEIHTKKAKIKNADFIGSCVYIPCTFYTSKFMQKKTKMQKKSKKKIQIAKMYMQEKSKILFKKKQAKKSRNTKKNTKKLCKKAGGREYCKKQLIFKTSTKKGKT